MTDERLKALELAVSKAAELGQPARTQDIVSDAEKFYEFLVS